MECCLELSGNSSSVKYHPCFRPKSLSVFISSKTIEVTPALAAGLGGHGGSSIPLFVVSPEIVLALPGLTLAESGVSCPDDMLETGREREDYGAAERGLTLASTPAVTKQLYE